VAFDYKLEFSYNESTPSDSSVYIQMRRNTPVYQAHIDKEDYDILSDELKHEFLTGLFNISGVVELSTKAYRIWLMKSPVFSWEEVLLPVLYFTANYYGESTISELPGSASPNGTGFKLNTPVQRRKI
jgi:hypothetical protein